MSTPGGSRNQASARHESVRALLAAYPGETDPKTLIRRLAREKIAYAKSLGWEGPPFCPKILASIFGIRSKEVSHDIAGDGRILLHPDGKLWIEYRSDRLPERQRFTIFHEFAHTLFPDYCHFLPLHNSPASRATDPEKEFEFLCDVAAAEMLLPVEDFSNDLKDLSWLGFEAIHQLRKRYQASIDATTYRLIELMNSVPCAAVFLTDQRQEAFRGYGPLWMKYSRCNTEFKGYVPPGNSPPRESVALQCFRNGVETTDPVRETWWINGKPRTWLVQATKLPIVPTNPEYAKVVALFFPVSYANTWASTQKSARIPQP